MKEILQIALWVMLQQRYQTILKVVTYGHQSHFTAKNENEELIIIFIQDIYVNLYNITNSLLSAVFCRVQKTRIMTICSVIEWKALVNMMIER